MRPWTHGQFSYAQGLCPIFEEFTFNDQGEMTFVDAWSDQPGMRPTEDPADAWAEAPTVHRLSTRVPGLGSATGLIVPTAEWMTAAAARDPELADFVRRTQSFYRSWAQAYGAAGPTAFPRGCGWTTTPGSVTTAGAGIGAERLDEGARQRGELEGGLSGCSCIAGPEPWPPTARAAATLA